jgi:hypothetical protein
MTTSSGGAPAGRSDLLEDYPQLAARVLFAVHARGCRLDAFEIVPWYELREKTKGCGVTAMHQLVEWRMA